MVPISIRWDKNKSLPEGQVIDGLVQLAGLSDQQRIEIANHAQALVERIRNSSKPGLMESFLAEYGLSTDEGIALMCLAEALLRVPDAETIDDLIEDKIAPSDWSSHLGSDSSPLVSASTWGLMLTGQVLQPIGEGVAGTLKSLV